MSLEPMQRLVRDLQQSGFEVSSVTKEQNSREPIMKIVTPDQNYSLYVKQSEYLADPAGLENNIRLDLRRRGYST